MQARKAASVEGLLARKHRQARDEAAATALLGREVLGRRAEAGQACEAAAMAWRLYEHQCKLLEVRAEAVLQVTAGKVFATTCLVASRAHVCIFLRLLRLQSNGSDGMLNFTCGHERCAGGGPGPRAGAGGGAACARAGVHGGRRPRRQPRGRAPAQGAFAVCTSFFL